MSSAACIDLQFDVIGFGKIVGEHLYLHTSTLPQLPHGWQALVAVVTTRTGLRSGENFNVIKIHRLFDELSLLYYPNFFSDPFPALAYSWRIHISRKTAIAGLLDAAAAADMLAWENSGFSVDASVRITLIDRDVPSYFQSLEHLLRYCARPPFALERLSVIRGPAGRIAGVRYVLPRHKAATWVGPGRGRKSTRPGANGVVELTPFEFLDRLADLVPPPRKHRHRYHGVFAPNHKLRKAVTALAIGNIGKPREAANGGHGNEGRDTGGCCDAHQKPRSHDTSRIAWAKLMARVGEEFPLECPACGGDIRLISFITEPGPIRKILTHLGEPLEPPPVSPARGPPTDWHELVQVHDDGDVFQASPDELPAIDIHSL